MAETFYPTVAFGFSGPKGKERLHQMWVDQWGKIDWRPVPMVEMGKVKKPDAIAGYVEDDGADDN